MNTTTSALCTYIASNTIALEPSTKPATAETPAQQTNHATSVLHTTKESDAFSKRDHRGNAQPSDRRKNTLDQQGTSHRGVRLNLGQKSIGTDLAEDGEPHHLKEGSLESTNRNKRLQDHRERRFSTPRKDTFTPTINVVTGSKTDHLTGLPPYVDSIKIRATMGATPIKHSNKQEGRHPSHPGLAGYQDKDQTQTQNLNSRSISLAETEQPETNSLQTSLPYGPSDCPTKEPLSTERGGPSSPMHSSSTLTSPLIPDSVDVVLNADEPPIISRELRHHHQRRFAGERMKPHTAKWIAQRIQESDTPAAVGILSAWTHHARRLEASEATIIELNGVPDSDIVEALNELRSPKRFIQGSKGNKLTMRVILSTIDHSQTLETTALLDSGCTGSTIHTRFVKNNNLPTKRLPRPIPVYNADGTLNANGAITETCKLRMTVQDHVEEIEFAVSDIGSSDVYIGHDWLKQHNPSVDWNKSRILMDRCPHTCDFTSGMDEDEPHIETYALNEEQTPLEEGDRLFIFDLDGYFDTLLINRTNYEYVLKYDPTRAESKVWTDVVPSQYHDYEDIFTKKDFDKLPERRPWDHAIELTPGFKPVDCKTYPLSPQEQEKLKEFVDENLRTGRIRPSSSPMASPFFFVKKKEGALRPTQDYRKLNDATIKNRYPLPLISELIDKLGNAKIFSKMDVRWGYNNIRIKEGDEWKAAFRTNLGLFEPTVMFFGLTNSPATFQSFMNSIFKPLIDRGVIAVYMDDILVFTETQEQHTTVVRDVLKILRENNLFLKPEKCTFHQPEVEYLGLIVGNKKARMDPTKVSAIRDWPIPTKKQEVQRFLGFCNFYRRFIKDYSKIAKPLTILTGDIPFEWTTHQQNAFETLITAITTQPVLALPRPTGQFRLEADSSDYAIGAVLSQFQDNKWHPIAYLSKSLTETQRNYEIYDKEMLAIMLALDEWRHYLIGASEPFEIWTDHQNLQYFRQPQKVNRRQARWLTELQQYHFKLLHKPGSTHTKPDFLSRPPGLDKGENDNKNVVLLPEYHFKSLMTQVNDTVTPTEAFPEAIRTRLTRIPRDKYDKQARRGLDTNDPDWINHGHGHITYKDRLYIPADLPLRTDIIQQHHDSITAGHPGRYKTQELITRDYWWPRMQGQIRKYIDGCDLCQRKKPHREKPRNPLHPHEIPSRPWQHISIDLITGLPESNGYNAILVIVDRLSKMIILVAIRDTLTSLQTAEIYRDHVWSKHGLPRKVISDRGPQFAAQFMKDLHTLIGVETNLSTAFHPQTDGQTERINQEVEQYLRLFINHRQTNWNEWLTCAEFSYNDKVHSSTGFSPFYVNYGRHPDKGTTVHREVKSQSATEFAQTMETIWEETAAALRLAAEQMKRYYDQHRNESRTYKPGDLVWLEGSNLSTDRPSKKLDDKRFGPYPIISKVGAAAYKLKLPRTWKTIWPVFNEVLLTPYTSPHFESQKQPPPPPPILIDQEPEYEVQEILDSKLSRGRLKYLVQWKGYPEPHERTWEPTSNLKNAPDAIRDFHRTHPSAPRPLNFDSLHFQPIPQYTQPDEQEIARTPSWTNGKIPTDTWNETRANIASSASCIAAPTLPEPPSLPLHDNDGWGPIDRTDSWTPIPQPEPRRNQHHTTSRRHLSRSPPPITDALTLVPGLPVELALMIQEELTTERDAHNREHSTMHWSTCKRGSCPYHYGHDSWRY